MGTGEKMAEVRVSPRAMYIAAGAVGIPITLLFLVLAGALGPAGQGSSILNLLIALALFVPLAWVHELLHALAALVCGGLAPRDVHIKVVWRAGGIVCHFRRPIRVRAVRVVGLTPLAVTGPLVIGLLMIYPHQATALLAGMTLVGCAMDVAAVWKLRRFDGDLLVVDHPTEPRFDIYTPEAKPCDDCGRQPGESTGQ